MSIREIVIYVGINVKRIVYTITLRNCCPDALSLVGDPLSGNGCGSLNHI